MKKELYLIGFLIGISCSVLAQSTDNFKMTLNGFGDIVYGQTFGPLANPAAATLYNLYGDPNYPTGMHNGFTFHGADFLGTVAYKDNFKFQTEINIEGSRGED